MVLETSHCPPFSLYIIYKGTCKGLIGSLSKIYILFLSTFLVIGSTLRSLLYSLTTSQKRYTFILFLPPIHFFLQFFGAYSDMRYAPLLQLCCKNNVTLMNYFLIHELCSFPLLHDAILHEGWLSICYCSFLFLHELFPMFSLDWCVLIVILELFQFCVCFKLA